MYNYNVAFIHGRSTAELHTALAIRCFELLKTVWMLDKSMFSTSCLRIRNKQTRNFKMASLKHN